MTDAPERIWVLQTAPAPEDRMAAQAMVWTQPAPHRSGDDVQYIRADLARPKVKLLVWSKRHEPNERCLAADCPWGRYKIVDRGEYGLALYTPRSGPPLGYFHTFEEAKAAAQADYERRILEALE